MITAYDESLPLMEGCCQTTQQLPLQTHLQRFKPSPQSHGLFFSSWQMMRKKQSRASG